MKKAKALIEGACEVYTSALRRFCESSMGNRGFSHVVMRTLLVFIWLLAALPAWAQVSMKSGNWSDPTVWSTATVPLAYSRVTINAGHTVTYDIASTQDLAEVFVYGTLTFSRLKNTQMDVGEVEVFPGGKLEVGTETAPIPAGVKAYIRLSDLPSFASTHNHGQVRLQPVLHAHGGIIDLHGAPRGTTWSSLTIDAPQGTSVLTLANDVSDWRPGEQIVITGSSKETILPGCTATEPILIDGVVIGNVESQSCRDNSSIQSEEAVINSVSGNRVILQSSLQYTHLGTFPRNAAVGLLTRNVVIVSKNPSARRGHVHIANSKDTTDAVKTSDVSQAIGRISYAEFYQLGRMEAGVYPVHFHLLGNGGRNSYVTGSSIHESNNLFVRVHGTNFLNVSGNVGYNGFGHGFATEDASEVFNVFEQNLAARTTKSVLTNPNDLTDKNEGSGFWLNNARNYIRNNYTADTHAWGFHIDVPNKMVSLVDLQGVPAAASVNVRSVEVLDFSGNKAYSGFRGGLEVMGLSTTRENRLLGFHAVDGRLTNFALFSSHISFDNLYAENGGISPSGTFKHFDDQLYVGQENLKLTSSHVSDLRIGYQFVGWALIQNGTLGRLFRGSLRPGEKLIIVDGNPGQTKLELLTTPVLPDNTTSQQEIYLMNYDGADRNVKLIPYGAMSTDNLTYRPSTRFGLTRSLNKKESFLEATFTGSEGPPLVMPLRIDVGNRPTVRDPDGSHDLFDSQRKRWRVDARYIASPPGYKFYRYGYNGILPPKTNPTDDFTTVKSNDRSLLGSFRSGWSFGYHVDVQNGDYWVDLGFQENFADMPTSAQGVGTRVFNVKAEETPMTANLDVYKEVGRDQPLWKSFQVNVADGQLTLEFSRVAGNAMVSAIAICPAGMAVNGRCP